MSLKELAAEADISEVTARRYAKRGVFRWVRDPMGKIIVASDAPEKARQQLREHGGAGGRPLPGGSDAG